MTDMRWIPMLAAALAVTACGGGGEPVAGVDRGGLRVAIVTKGEITGFGSVIVNGVRYETSAAAITVDGEAGTEQDLSVGAVVTIRGQVDQSAATGTADSIVFDDNVEGTISAVDVGAGTAIVLGQTVRISLDTLFEGDIASPDISALSPGDAVEVSGFEQADGSIEATLVRVKPVPDRLEVTGVAAAVDTAAKTFRVGALVVDYATAMLEGFSGCHNRAPSRPSHWTKDLPVNCPSGKVTNLRHLECVGHVFHIAKSVQVLGRVNELKFGASNGMLRSNVK